MDGPLVYRLDCQVYGRVAKSGRDKRWRHLSVKPPSRWDIPPSGVRPLEDYKVDRAEVEVWQHMELTVTNRVRAWPTSRGSGQDVTEMGRNKLACGEPFMVQTEHLRSKWHWTTESWDAPAGVAKRTGDAALAASPWKKVNRYAG